MEPETTQARPLRVGERVRSANDEPMFASDPQSGDVGKVVQTSASSSLVRWADGSESWAARPSLEPLQIGDPIAVGVAAGGTPVASSLPTMMPPPKRPQSRFRRAVLTILSLLLVLPTLLSALARFARHPTPLKIALVGLGASALIVLVAVSRRRTAAREAAPDPDTMGTLDSG